MAAHVEPIVGRYVHLEIEGRPQRVYFEEAGQGIPLVCLHTAGADGRQYRLMQNLGHFPMSENPEQFRRYILPVLDRIRGA
jgi:hypothetical protein